MSCLSEASRGPDIAQRSPLLPQIFTTRLLSQRPATGRLQITCLLREVVCRSTTQLPPHRAPALHIGRPEGPAEGQLDDHLQGSPVLDAHGGRDLPREGVGLQAEPFVLAGGLGGHTQLPLQQQGTLHLGSICLQPEDDCIGRRTAASSLRSSTLSSRLCSYRGFCNASILDPQWRCTPQLKACSSGSKCWRRLFLTGRDHRPVACVTSKDASAELEQY